MLETTQIAPASSEAAHPLRTPFGVNRRRSEVESLWMRPLFRLLGCRKELASAWLPTFDVYAFDGELVLKADLPGLRRDDIRVYLEDGSLVLLGQRQDEKSAEKESYYLAERSSGSFYRRLPLAFEADASRIAARFSDGVLEVRVAMPAVEQATLQAIPVH